MSLSMGHQTDIASAVAVRASMLIAQFDGRTLGDPAPQKRLRLDLRQDDRLRQA
jgi:hypothetical protein